MQNFVFYFSFLFCFLLIFNSQGQEGNIRQPVVAGSFYPAGAQQLTTDLASYFDAAQDKTIDKNISALIVPHAGYVFSGEVAASAYAKLDPEKEYSRVFVIGTSHHVLLNGASINTRSDYQTPLGVVTVDTGLANQLIGQNKFFRYTPGAHDREHSIEVQLPFLLYRLKKPFKLVPIIIGTQSEETIRDIAEALKPHFTPDNLFVISTDFSHYPAYADAVKNDKITGDAIQTNSPEKFSEAITANSRKNIPGLATSCCAWSSVLTLLDITSQIPGIKISHILYKNSGDSSYGGKNEVVGYHSFVFTHEKTASASGQFLLAPGEKKLLLEIARENIESRLDHHPLPILEERQLPAALKTPCGAFVTLHKNGDLRGCIGRFIATEPLYQVVQEMAQAAAFDDDRFDPVNKTEMKEIEIEISVLTPLKRIHSADELELGKHGIYMIKGNRGGTFLPQVATETGWNREEFLGHCARDKAGIGWDGWKDAELYTYEALVFSEKELSTSKK